MTWIEWLLSRFRRRPPPPPPPPPGSGGDLLALHNAERLRLGRAALVSDARLMKMAQSYAQQMADANQMLFHAGFEQRLRQSGYPFSMAAENETVGASALIAWQSWVGSRPHYTNAVNPAFRDAGFGSATGSNGRTYWCAVFGG